MGLLDGLFGNNNTQEGKVEEPMGPYTEEKLDEEMNEYFSPKEAELGITKENRGVRFEDLGQE